MYKHRDLWSLKNIESREIMQHLDHETTKASISIKFPDIYANSPTASPSFNASNVTGNNDSTPRSSSSASLNELAKFQKDVDNVAELFALEQKADAEMAEVKNDLIKVIVNTLMMNK